MTWIKYLKDTVLDPNDNVPIGDLELMPIRVDQKGVVPSYQLFLLLTFKLLVINDVTVTTTVCLT